jgi:hypothetical protein
MAWSAIPAKSFICHFCNVGTSHDHQHSGGTDGICHAISFGNHPGHRANANQINLLFADVPGNSKFIHRLSVTIDQDNFMAGWSQRLQEKHPKMRHEIARNPVIGVVE